MSRVHDYPSAFPQLTLTHIHTDACCGLDESGRPSFKCDVKPNACTTCLATGASKQNMEICVRERTK